jgi:hypothetical protein
MSKVSNKAKWPNAIVLDALVQNEDLKDVHVLITVDGGTTNFWHVDHGHTLGVTRGWASLNPEHAVVRNLYPSLVHGHDPFKDAFERLEAMSEDAIQVAVQQCPLEHWGVASSELENLVSYVMSAKTKVRQSIIASKATWSNWE